MKVYSCPTEVPPPVVDYSNYDQKKEAEAENNHMAELKAWLIKHGYTGKRTGEIVRFPVADSYAVYMFAEGRQSALIHLPYADGYQYRDVVYLPKAEIVRRIEAEKRMNALFQSKS